MAGINLFKYAATAAKNSSTVPRVFSVTSLMTMATTGRPRRASAILVARNCDT
jgi:hypothetical protein